MSGETFLDKLRVAFGGTPTTVGGKRLVSRTDAAKVCARALARIGVLGIPHAPRGDAGRVAVVLALITAEQRTRLGWIEIKLNGDLALALDNSSVAAARASAIQQLVRAAFADLAVRPVKPDPRTWLVAGRRIAQIATGQWTVTDANGALVATVDAPEDAVRVAQAQPVASPARERSAVADMLVEMERDHAARWVAKQLRAHGYQVRVEGPAIALVLPSFVTTLRVGNAGLDFDPTVPALARSVAEAALRRVGIVDHLE